MTGVVEIAIVEVLKSLIKNKIIKSNSTVDESSKQQNTFSVQEIIVYQASTSI